MTSINDQVIEKLFHSDPIIDDGFSERIVERVRLRLRLQRFIVPVALVVGGLLAFKPLVDLLQVFSGMTAYLPASLAEQAVAALPSLPTTLTAVVIIVAAVCFAPVLDE